jgi:hypothetical protein
MAESLTGIVIAQAVTFADEGVLEPHEAADRLVMAAEGDRSVLVGARDEVLQRLRDDPDNASLNRAVTILNLTVGGGSTD